MASTGHLTRESTTVGSRASPVMRRDRVHSLSVAACLEHRGIARPSLPLRLAYCAIEGVAPAPSERDVDGAHERERLVNLWLRDAVGAHLVLDTGELLLGRADRSSRSQDEK